MERQYDNYDDDTKSSVDTGQEVGVSRLREVGGTRLEDAERRIALVREAADRIFDDYLNNSKGQAPFFNRSYIKNRLPVALQSLIGSKLIDETELFSRDVREELQHTNRKPRNDRDVRSILEDASLVAAKSGRKLNNKFLEAHYPKLAYWLEVNDKSPKDFMSKDTPAQWEYQEQNRERTIESARSELNELFETWKSKQDGNFNTGYIQSQKQGLFQWFYNRNLKIYDYLSNEAKESWSYKDYSPKFLAEQKVKLEKLFGEWEQEPAQNRRPFGAAYVKKKDKALYHWFYRYAREKGERMEDHLSDRARSHWQRLSYLDGINKKWTEELARKTLEELFQIWRAGDKKIHFGPYFLQQESPLLYAWIHRREQKKSLTLESLLSPEARQAWKHLRPYLVANGNGREAKHVRGKKDVVPDNPNDRRLSGQEEKKNISEVREAIMSTEFKKLVGLFGASRTVDTLYAYRPDLRKVPPDRLRKVIAQYLGNFLLTRPPFNGVDIEAVQPYLDNQNLQEGLYEVIKDATLRNYLACRVADKTQTDGEIFAKYFHGLSTNETVMNDQALQSVLGRARNYYVDIISTSTSSRPKALVANVREGRDFPDIYQAINIKELRDKQRLLIADEMGVGKSGSTILAKEYLGVRTALVVVPSNVQETWLRYLSDQNKDGRQLGYFKKGQSPSVLCIKTAVDLKKLDSKTYDYIILSQERLSKPEYVEALEAVDFDMLVADEVHKLKNVKSGKRSANFLRLADKIEGDNKYLALLSGTPAPNKVEDIAVVLRLLYPERFRHIENKHLTTAILRGSIADTRALLVAKMQRKNLAGHIEMPALSEINVSVELDQQEKELYEILLEKDEFRADEKIRLLRQFCMNHDLLKVTPGLVQAKADQFENVLGLAFEKHKKVLVFVNAYVETVMRGDLSILDKINLPPGVAMYTVHGDNRNERQIVQDILNNSDGKMLVVVSGQTADAGVDYSGAEHVIFYNEPWTKDDKRQLIGRVYRPDLKGDLIVETLITRGTIEEGIHRYIEVKARALEKLIEGIPITQLEEQILRTAEITPAQDLEVNRDLAESYFSAIERLNAIYAHVKGIGGKKFYDFLQEYGSLYAECYLNIGSRSYQGNASRVSGTLLDTMVRERKERQSEIKILDVASGPEMLRRHSLEDLQRNIYSLDMNKHHFSPESKGASIGSFSALPYYSGTFNYVNLSLALHYTEEFAPSKQMLERGEVFMEINRILKIGGRAIISLVHKRDLKDMGAFTKVMRDFGFTVVAQYSGDVKEGNQFKARVITLEKIGEPAGSLQEIIDTDPSGLTDGLKMIDRKGELRDSRQTLTHFTLGSQRFKIGFNAEDQDMLREEQYALREGERLKKRYGSIEEIPVEDLKQHRFARMRIRDKYVLFKKLEKGNGGVRIDND
ncbi:MAG: hypothetical protein HZA95_00205 [Candidatus Vogelbacteria bacterium]|nr:hypothetical protein [Candidatus Vogelbacteria bacterium]